VNTARKDKAMTTSTFTRTLLGMVAGALLLAACGGGGGGDTPIATDPPVAGTEVPVSASTSAAGAFTFVSGLAAAGNDTAEPLVVGDATLAGSDTDEPDPGV
jgi:ABC-type glycerol-3-phosphate transport system substrate-binding protein